METVHLCEGQEKDVTMEIVRLCVDQEKDVTMEHVHLFVGQEKGNQSFRHTVNSSLPKIL